MNMSAGCVVKVSYSDALIRQTNARAKQVRPERLLRRLLIKYWQLAWVGDERLRPSLSTTVSSSSQPVASYLRALAERSSLKWTLMCRLGRSATRRQHDRPVNLALACNMQQERAPAGQIINRRFACEWHFQALKTSYSWMAMTRRRRRVILVKNCTQIGRCDTIWRVLPEKEMLPTKLWIVGTTQKENIKKQHEKN